MINNVLKHGRNYFTGSIVNSIIKIALIPVFTSLLAPDEFGTYSLFLSYLGIATILLTFNFHGSVNRYYHDKTNDYPEFVFFSLHGSMIILLLMSIVIFLYRKEIDAILKLDDFMLLILILTLFFKLPAIIFNHICVAQQRSWLTTMVTLIQNNITPVIALIIIYLSIFDNKVSVLLVLNLIITILVALIVLYLIKIKFDLKYAISCKKEHFKYIVSYSIALIPYFLAGQLLLHLDRIMIGTFFGKEEVGLYSLAYNIGMMLAMVSAALNTAFMPDWFKAYKKNQFKEIKKTTLMLHDILIIFALAGIIFAKEFFTLVVNERYFLSYNIVGVIIIAYYIDSLFKIYGRDIGGTNKMIYVSFCGVIAVFSNALLNYYLLPLFGYEIAAYTTLISMFIMMLMGYLISKYYLKLKVIELPTLLGRVLVLIMTALFVLYLDNLNLSFINIFVYKLILIIVFSIFIYKKIMETKGNFASE